jgi:hypothetical protein
VVELKVDREGSREVVSLCKVTEYDESGKDSPDILEALVAVGQKKSPVIFLFQ